MNRLVIIYFLMTMFVSAYGQPITNFKLDEIIIKFLSDKEISTKNLICLKHYEDIFNNDTIVFYDNSAYIKDSSICEITVLTFKSKKHLWLTTELICKKPPVYTYDFPCSTFKYKTLQGNKMLIKNKCNIKHIYQLKFVRQITNDTKQYTFIRQMN